ncbi:MAG: 6-phosphogluconolactonase [Nakamurella sp.]
MSPQLVLLPTSDDVAADAAARLITTLVDLQWGGRVPSVVLTGGTIGIGLLTKIRESTSRNSVDWRRVEIFWGDERFVGAGDGERNERQAREALLDHVPVDPERVHPMAASDGPFGADVDAAAAAYADLVDAHGPFDVTLLGLGPDGHVASIFPEHPSVYDTRTALPVRHSPKPPPTRISLSLPTIRTSTEVWVVTGGSGKADAVAMALGGAGEVAIPAVGAVGTSRTLWLMDRDSAVRLPSSVFRAPIA